MAPIAKEPEAFTSENSNSGTTSNSGSNSRSNPGSNPGFNPGSSSSSGSAGKSQPAALEISVTVNGARTVQGSEKREPFSESTRTVLVFASGAVIRLASPVAAGQLVFLTNEKTKKEVVCQVVKSRSHSNASGYVELEFTEPSAGFWGMRFPAEAPAQPASPATKVITSPTLTSAPPTKSLKENLDESKAKTPAPSVHTVPAIHKPIDITTGKLDANSQPLSSMIARNSKELKPAPIVPAQPPSTIAKIPTLSEFLTQSGSSPALSPSEKAKRDIAERKSEPRLQSQNKYAEQLQNELSAKLFAPDAARQGSEIKISASAQSSKSSDDPELKSSLNSLLSPAKLKDDPAPGASSFDFGVDEIKIPAWLEPLARNSSSSAATTEVFEPVHQDTKITELKTRQGEFSDAAVSVSAVQEPESLQSVPATHASDPGTPGAVLTISADGPVPNFGSSLSVDTQTSEIASTPAKSGNWLRLGVIAAGFLFTIGGGWYLYSTRSTAAAINGLAVNSASSKIPESASSAIAGANTGTANGGFAGESNRPSVNSQTIRGEGNTSAALANSLSKLAISSDSLVAQSDGSSSAASAANSGKKSKFGRLHLAAPKLSRHASAADSAINLAPSFNELNGDAMPNDAADMNVLANKSNQPSAPIPLGGNVVPARLLSSVAPVYPQLARSQRLSGEVKIDALIGANGHVSATKVISGPALLQQAAMDAVRNWNYQPATLNGQTVSMHLTVTVQFKLQ